MKGRKVVRDKETGEMVVVNRKSPARKDHVFRRLQASLSREEWLAVFEGSEDEKARLLLAMMLDPSTRKRSLPQMAGAVGLSYAAVLQMVTRGRLEQGLLRMSEHVPQVLEDVAVDAKSREVTCQGCRGFKVDGVAVVPVMEETVEEEGKRKILAQALDSEGRLKWEKCLTCDGSGTLRKIGDSDARKLLFDTLKLTGQRGPLVAIQNNNGMPSMEDVVGGVHEVLDAK